MLYQLSDSVDTLKDRQNYLKTRQAVHATSKMRVSISLLAQPQQQADSLSSPLLSSPSSGGEHARASDVVVAGGGGGARGCRRVPDVHDRQHLRSEAQDLSGEAKRVTERERERATERRACSPSSRKCTSAAGFYQCVNIYHRGNGENHSTRASEPREPSGDREREREGNGDEAPVRPHLEAGPALPGSPKTVLLALEVTFLLPRDLRRTQLRGQLW